MAAEIDRRVSRLPDRRIPTLRALREEYTDRLSSEDPQTMIELGLQLIRMYGHCFLACELIHYHPGAMAELGEDELQRLGRGMDFWDSVDRFGQYLAGPAWNEGNVKTDLIRRWARSKNRWWRRAALASVVALNVRARGGSGDTQKTLSICREVVDDRDRLVVRALSRALRSLVEHDKEAVKGFLREYGKALASRVRREVRRKVRTGVKGPRKGRRSRR
jgi:3-methyladenine DNA glycosylase AlkD